jgi:tetratricopeptide (TPR) repeat protein
LQQCDSMMGVAAGVEATLREEKEDDDEFQLQLAKDCFDKGIAEWSEGEFDLAEVEFRRSLEIRELCKGAFDEDTAKSYLWTGSIYLEKQEYDRALNAFCRCFRIRVQLTGNKDHCGIVKNWINKVLDAKGFKDKDNYWQAFISSIEHKKRGDELYEGGMYKDAICEYRTALSLEQRRRASYHRNADGSSDTSSAADVADLYSKVAKAYTADKSYDRATRNYRNALSLYLAGFGRYHWYTAVTLDDIGSVANKKGWNDIVVNEYLDSLFQSILHEKTGDAFLKRKDYLRATVEYEQALKLEEAGIGKLQLTSASIYCKLASIHAAQGAFDTALPLYCKAYGIYDSCLGRMHQDSTNTIKLIKRLLSMHNVKTQSSTQ